MYTSAPDITNDATVGQVIVAATATPTTASSAAPTSTPTSTPVATISPTPEPAYIFPVYIPEVVKRFKPRVFSIYGYGPINSEVYLKGFGVSEKTSTNSNGLFRFESIYSYSSFYPELCIQLIDSKRRSTQPSCIPAFPIGGIIPQEVGPLLLSPSISISQNKIDGQTIPNADVFIHLYKKNGFKLPVINIKSDVLGAFDINLPTSDMADYKVFASTKLGEYQSAKSTTLNFSVISRAKTFWESVINFILENKIMVFILLEVLVFVLLFVSALKYVTKRHKRHNERDYLEEVKSIT